jgi:circadian clock protein KaiC
MSEADRTELKRIETGHAEADVVLHGGFPASSTNIIMGQPGTGKTILAQQILFHNAGPDRPAVYLATLSEPLSKVLTYLQQFDFYDESRMLDSVLYQDIGEEILERGAEYMVEHVESLIREQRPGLLVIDSFKAVHDLSRSTGERRRLSARLGSLLSAYDITAFLVGEYVPDDVSLYPEFAVADGVVELARRGSDKRDERYLRVRKLRGSGYSEGLHAFEITPRGLRVYPRLVTPRSPPPYEPDGDRASTGVDGLDEIMEGGLLRSTTGLVLGAAGTGKTTLGLAFVLRGVESGEPSLFLNFQENPTQLAATIRRRGLDLDDYIGNGLHLRYVSPVELRIDSLVGELFDTVETHGIRRVVIDALGDLQLAAISVERFHDYLYSMTQLLAARRVTTLLTLEARHAPSYYGEGVRESRLSTLCDTLIALENDQRSDPPVRRLRVIKSRGSGHSLEPQPFVITPSGLKVGRRANG